MRIRISRSLVINTLCAACGVMLAYDLPWFIKLYYLAPSLWKEAMQCCGVDLR